MTEPLLQVRNLQTHFGWGEYTVRAVDGVDFDVCQGETFALLGESGCGKSMTAHSIMRLIPGECIVGGSVRLHGQDLLRLPEARMRGVRGGRIGMIFQEPMTSLNPVLTVGQQIGEVLRNRKGLRGRAARARAVELLDAVGIPDPGSRYDEYPHQLSGGMKQRALIAATLAGEPELLIADEPTTALDVTIQAQVLDLLRDLQKRNGMALLLITHDLGVVAEMADRVAVMYAGQIVEQAPVRHFFADPRHPYSQRLFEALPSLDKREAALNAIPGTVPSLMQRFTACRFEPRCDFAGKRCREREPDWYRVDRDHGARCYRLDPEWAETQPVRTPGPAPVGSPVEHGQGSALSIDEVKVHFPIEKGLLKRTVGYVRAVDGVSLDIPGGRTLALVGESGCGKTTLAKAVVQLLRPTAGRVTLGDTDLATLNRSDRARYGRELQMVFQDPFSSMNPRLTVGEIVAEGLRNQRFPGGEAERAGRVGELLEQVGLSADMMRRYPHEFSGGQRQRICIARALAPRPSLLICDEPTSALDVSVQAQILNLLSRLQRELGLTYLFITHNIAVVAYLAHEVAVMYLGRIVERGPVREVLEQPKHPYTQALLAAVPAPEPDSKREVIRLAGDQPSPAKPPAGCHFHPRCPKAMAQCQQDYPGVSELGAGRLVRCYLYE